MKTLVISAPRTKSGPPGYRGFANTLQLQVGQEYALFWTKNMRGQLSSGMRVVVIDKPSRQQAEVTLVGWTLQPMQPTYNRVEHYDVVMQGLTVVPFNGGSIRLNRRGLAII